MGQNVCKCPEPKRIVFPKKIWEMAGNGDTEIVRQYVSLGSDVNAANEKGETLLSQAARNGQHNIILELTKSSYLHLNTYHEYNGSGAYTPLWIAAANGHFDCVKVLLQSNLSCRIDLIGSQKKNSSAVMIAAKKGNWNIVNEILKVCEDLNSEEADYIFPLAVKGMQWNTGITSLNCCSFYDTDVLVQFLNQAIKADYWRVICVILSKDFRGKSINLLNVFSIVVKKRKWDRVTELLKMIDDDLDFNMDLVKAALSDNYPEVIKLVKENNYSHGTYQGNLFVIAAGGTNEFIVDYLYSIKTYDQHIVDYILCLSAMNGRLEFLQQMFMETSDYVFTYRILSIAQTAASQYGHVNADRLLSKILDKEAEICATNYLRAKYPPNCFDEEKNTRSKVVDKKDTPSKVVDKDTELSSTKDLVGKYYLEGKY
ncbi:uncharacterized protein [Palaemon carinicauda]|uniref:uncharacterized protein n=1 Tax=Palaemon carinicauda TaxID=392227 RepID=UPI0035B657C0